MAETSLGIPLVDDGERADIPATFNPIIQNINGLIEEILITPTPMKKIISGLTISTAGTSIIGILDTVKQYVVRVKSTNLSNYIINTDTSATGSINTVLQLYSGVSIAIPQDFNSNSVLWLSYVGSYWSLYGFAHGHVFARSQLTNGSIKSNTTGTTIDIWEVL